MVRTRTTGSDGQPPVPPVRAARGRGRGRGRGVARTTVGTAPVVPPVIPSQEQIPNIVEPARSAQASAVPIEIAGIQETLAQILAACTGLAQVVSTQAAPATSKAGGGTHTPVARTPDQVVQGLQIPGALPSQPAVAAQASVVPVMADDEQRRLERFERLRSPPFSGTESEDAQDFLDRCQRMLQTAGILETSGVSFTTFQFSGSALRWWETYERRRPVGAAPLTWHQFSVVFLEMFVPQSRREEMRRQFEQLRQGDMSVTRYVMRFSELARHAV